MDDFWERIEKSSLIFWLRSEKNNHPLNMLKIEGLKRHVLVGSIGKGEYHHRLLELMLMLLLPLP